MNLKNFSAFQYRLFCKAEGSQHIVSEFALYHILKLIEKYSVESVLEVGLGIGTISGSILKYAEKSGKNISSVGTESNDFCLRQIPSNLGSNYKKLKILPEVSQIDSTAKFDLIIIDGAENNLELVKDLIAKNGILLIEGDRSGQEKTIKKVFPDAKFVHLISLKKNGDYSVKRARDYRGGLKVLFIDPNTNQKIHWVELRLKSAFKAQIRKNFT